MWLLNVIDPTTTVEFIGSDIPPYAILSHAWGEEEVTFQELGKPDSAMKKGYAKINQTCRLAARDGHQWVWVDTCCINKESSTELSEAINSMFHWYQQAKVCYVYLEDLDPGADLETDLRKCRWFTRGWTLQELIAPKVVSFYDSEWNCRGTKVDLASLVSRITGVPQSLLENTTRPSDFSIASRMSWAAGRETKRVEDIAYCLLGIFDVHLTPRYGERMKAFTRLQDAIIRQPTAELTIFAWTAGSSSSPPGLCSVLAESPDQFGDCGTIEQALEDSIYRDFTPTTRGIQVDASLRQVNPEEEDEPGSGARIILPLYAKRTDGVGIGIYLRKISGSVYARDHAQQLVFMDDDFLSGELRLPVVSILLASSLAPRYRFHATDPVLGNRCGALQIRLEQPKDPRLAGRLTLRADTHPFSIFPMSHWDCHDRCFFATNSATKGWVAFTFQAILSPEYGKGSNSCCFTQSFFAACFFWNYGGARVVVAPLSSVDSPTLGFLKNSLRGIRFESAVQTEEVVRTVFWDKIGSEEGSTTIEVPLEVDTDEYLEEVGVGHGTKETSLVPVTFSLALEKEDNPRICVNPVTILKVNARIQS